MNNKGNTSFIGLVILLLVFFSILKVLETDINIIRSEKESYQLLLCSKELNGETVSLIKDINQSNFYLKLITIGDWATAVIPGSLLYKKILKNMGEKYLKIEQKFKIGAYLNKLFHLRKKGCSISIGAENTPYKFYSKRNHLNQLKTRGKEWRLTIRGKGQKVKTRFILKQEKSMSQVTKGVLSWL